MLTDERLKGIIDCYGAIKDIAGDLNGDACDHYEMAQELLLSRQRIAELEEEALEWREDAEELAGALGVANELEVKKSEIKFISLETSAIMENKNPLVRRGFGYCFLGLPPSFPFSREATALRSDLMEPRARAAGLVMSSQRISAL